MLQGLRNKIGIYGAVEIRRDDKTILGIIFQKEDGVTTSDRIVVLRVYDISTFGRKSGIHIGSIMQWYGDIKNIIHW